MTAPWWPRIGTGSLRLRLLGATLVTLALALTGAHWWLSSLFRDHVWRQFDVALVQQLDQLTARLSFDSEGLPSIDPGSLSDPRWDRPYSGLYWQLDRVGAPTPTGAPAPGRTGVLRSRSLWDSQLHLPLDALAPGSLHTHEAAGPGGEAVRVVERTVAAGTHAREIDAWRLIVAADTQETQQAMGRFSGLLAASLAGLGALLALAALAQVSVGLAPLRRMREALQRLRDGHARRLEGDFPMELQPLIHDFNSVLERNAEVVERARTQAGNLAHALKTPLAALRNAARQSAPSELGTLVSEQVEQAQRHIQWHLARARAAATQHLPGQRTPLAPALAGLVRVMDKVHAERAIAVNANAVAPELAFAGEAQDLQDMLGNLLDNACRSARRQVEVTAQRDGPQLCIAVDDDGPGIDPELRPAVLRRGVRLDEMVPGSGLGLSIVVELASLYGGELALQDSPLGGLRALLILPHSPETRP
ncbi:MAG: sensor histidine kinase [Hydrogenophaga sp.]|nr:sensor histidine kinase [Hydrogenophaga sp.]